MSNDNAQTPPDQKPAVGGPVLSEQLGVTRYPLSVENVGEDTYILMSKGHHDVHEFMRAVRAEGYTWPLGMPTHEWMRAIPAPANSDYRCLYVEAKPHSRGAFPATYAREAWGEDRYEAQQHVTCKKCGYRVCHKDCGAEDYDA